MLLEFILWLVILYFVIGIGLYFYAVFKTFEFTGIWNWKITRCYIGICKYPYWLLFWLEKIVNWLKGGNNVRKDKSQKNV